MLPDLASALNSPGLFLGVRKSQKTSLFPRPDRVESIEQPERSMSKISVSAVGRCETGRMGFAFSGGVSPVSKAVRILQR